MVLHKIIKIFRAVSRGQVHEGCPKNRIQGVELGSQDCLVLHVIKWQNTYAYCSESNPSTYVKCEGDAPHTILKGQFEVICKALYGLGHRVRTMSLSQVLGT